MTPGLYSLFNRGRYRRPATMTKAERKEAERFAVAALAFTLQNNTDQRFCQNFLEAICGLPRQAACECPKIFIEQHHWADLLLKVGNYVVVIECKLTAPLGDAQNPQEEESFYGSEDGYGRALLQEYKKSGDHIKKHYVVLGHRQPLKPISKHGVLCLQRQWREARVDKPSPMVDDLFDCLGNLGVVDFRSMKTNGIVIGQNAPLVARAAALLSDACDDLELKKREWRADSSLERDSWWSGVTLTKPKKKASDRVKNLSKTVRPPGGDIGWFGYQSDQDDESKTKSQLAVWFYCSTEKNRDKIKAQLKRGAPKLEVKTSEDESGWHAFAVLPVESSPGDKEWFVSVLNKVS